MSKTPTLPGEKPEVSEVEERIIEQRLATFDEDRKSAVDARQAIAAIRKNLQQHSPR